ncbi:bifunctional riboflavin kinase/FAD synthetase [Thiomicrorhabdus indica]|uniref:bifunctional riboflavin kinase/FAD synthetase n=1 Tax=Thiomicrorhabdus indica TaxID=2267253 RepID=UPI002AA699E0|nr:bifunctional riboflavin kinase/FAD synthetase [Thiomicrorhabdus indica]
MQLIRGLHNLAIHQAELAKGCVLTIGNFDGVHLGHQQVLNALHNEAVTRNLPSVVMVFEPLPIEFFSPEKAPVRLMNLREKLQAFDRTEIDYVICVRFNEKFAGLTAGEFVHSVLIDGFNVKHLIVGDDFHFGKGRGGDFAFLQSFGEKSGFSVVKMPTHVFDGNRVSSTRVRAELSKPDLAAVETLIGRSFSFNGRVIHGQKLGRTIGFPTLNLNPKRIQMPVHGVFAVEVLGIADKPWPAVANLGLRPTVDGIRPSIEVHLFDWSEDLYGHHIDVILRKFIRPEMKFNGLEQLQAQIAQDAIKAREFFKL